MGMKFQISNFQANSCDWWRGISWEIALSWMSLDFSDNKSALVQVMAWCRQATSHYLNQCWRSSPTPYGVTRLQWVKRFSLESAASFSIITSNKCFPLGFPRSSLSITGPLWCPLCKLKVPVIHSDTTGKLWGIIKLFALGETGKDPYNRKWQDYVYIQCEYKSTKQKIKHLLREENKVKENKIS